MAYQGGGGYEQQGYDDQSYQEHSGYEQGYDQQGNYQQEGYDDQSYQQNEGYEDQGGYDQQGGYGNEEHHGGQEGYGDEQHGSHQGFGDEHGRGEAGGHDEDGEGREGEKGGRGGERNGEKRGGEGGRDSLHDGSCEEWEEISEKVVKITRARSKEEIFSVTMRALSSCCEKQQKSDCAKRFKMLAEAGEAGGDESYKKLERGGKKKEDVLEKEVVVEIHGFVSGKDDELLERLVEDAERDAVRYWGVDENVLPKHKHGDYPRKKGGQGGKDEGRGEDRDGRDDDRKDDRKDGGRDEKRGGEFGGGPGPVRAPPARGGRVSRASK